MNTVKVKVHVCAECRHHADSHATSRDLSGWGGNPRVGPCSMGGCACLITKSEVIERNPAESRNAVPGFDHKTNTWKPR